MRLLFVDDDPSVRRALQRELRSAGHEVIAEPDPFAAFDRLRGESFAVVISDEAMPEMRGIEFLERCAAEFPDVVRILLTGNQDAKTVSEALARGKVFRVLHKPWDHDDLVKTIQQAGEQYEQGIGSRAATRKG